METVSYTIGLTGAMGAGKSEAAKAFASMGCFVLDADILGHFVLDKDSEVRKKTAEILGGGIFLDDGSANRKAIAAKAFADKNLMSKLEAVLHPAIKRLWESASSQTFRLEYEKYAAGERAARENAIARAVKNTSRNAMLFGAQNLRGVCRTAVSPDFGGEEIFEIQKRRFPEFAELPRAVAAKIADSGRPPRVVEAALLFEKKLEKNFAVCVDVFCGNALRLKRLKMRGMDDGEIAERDAFQLPPEKKASLADAVLFNESDRAFLEIQAAIFLSRLNLF